jgi:hypothetical protein
MRKKLLALISFLIVLGSSISMVSANAADGKSDTVKFYGQTMYRG